MRTILIFIASLLLLTGCNVGSLQTTQQSAPAGPSIVLTSVQGVGFFSGAGTASSPFQIRAGFGESQSPYISLIYTNVGQTNAMISNVIQVNTLSYNVVYTNCIGSALLANRATTCVVRLQLLNNNVGYPNATLPTLIYSTVSEPAQQLQPLWNSSTAVFVNVMYSSGNTVIAYVTPSNTITGAVGTTGFVTIQARTDSGVATNFQIDLSGLSGVLGFSNQSASCPSVDTSGVVCQIPLQFSPTNALPLTTVILPFTYTNDSGLLYSGTIVLQVQVN